MSEALHTPGPWEVGDLDQNGQRIVRQEHIEICTCWHHCVGSIEQEMEANARLIAAAPELLEMLKAAFYELVGTSLACRVAMIGWRWPEDGPRSVNPTWEFVRAAIAKAEGRP